MTAGDSGRAGSRAFLPPRGRDLLSPEHTDQETGWPLWIELVEEGAWTKCQTDVQLADRLVSQSQAYAWAPPRKRGDPGIGGPGLLLDSSWIAPRWLPRLATDPMVPHHGFGRPPRRVVKRKEVLYVAWARDVAHLTVAEVAELLYAQPGDHLGYELDRVKNAQRDGRELYGRTGVLPWAAYERGRPASDWPTDPAFIAAMDRWKLEADQRQRDRGSQASGEPVTLEAMKRDAEELGLHVAGPIGQRAGAQETRDAA